MKAWVLERHGPPHRAFALRKVEDPVPGVGQVLIRAEGFGLNYADVMASRGLYREAPPPPCILGYETVGRVEHTGDGVPGELRGRRVVALTRFGGYAQVVCTDHRAVVPIPEDMPLGLAASLATQGATAWYTANHAYALSAGQRVLIHSAAGGVGHLLVQIALRRGCEVFAVASGHKKMAFLRSLGAQHVIDRAANDHAVVVRSLLGPNKLDVSFNAVGGSTYKKDMRLLGAGGIIVLYGGAERSAGSGPLATFRFVWSMGLVVPIFLMMKSQGILGVNMLKIGEHRPDQLAHCLREMVGAAVEGWLQPHVHHEFPHDQLPEAIAALAGGGTIGKVAVRW